MHERLISKNREALARHSCAWVTGLHIYRQIDRGSHEQHNRASRVYSDKRETGKNPQFNF